MKLRISSYLARVSWFRRKNYKKKSKTKLKQAIKLTFMLFFFSFFSVGTIARWEIRE